MLVKFKKVLQIFCEKAWFHARALFLGEMRNISPISFELRPLEYIISTWLLTIQKIQAKYFEFRWKISPVESSFK